MAEPDRLETDQQRALGQLAPVAHQLGLYLAGGSALAFYLHEMWVQIKSRLIEQARRALRARLAPPP